MVNRSPSDEAWRRILNNDSSDIYSTRLRALLGSEDSYDLCLGPLHRIVVGLSCADLQTQIDLEPARIDDRDWLGSTPLIWAAARGNQTYLSLLLSRGAQVNVRDSEGRTALHHAATNGSLECIRALLNAGAEPNSTALCGLTPLHGAIYFDNCSDVEQTVPLLLDHGADLEARNMNGWTPMYAAAESGSYEAVAVLIKYGADVNALDSTGLPPIYAAMIQRHDDVVHLLCQNGAMTSWTSPVTGDMNLLKGATFFGTARMMDLISDSDIPPIECDRVALEWWFNDAPFGYMDVRSSTEEERLAFYRLLDKKAVPLDLGVDHSSPIAIEDSPGETRSRDDDSDDQQDDVFEDAVEYLSLLDEHDKSGFSSDHSYFV
jgi:hypothetical protein